MSSFAWKSKLAGNFLSGLDRSFNTPPEENGSGAARRHSRVALAVFLALFVLLLVTACVTYSGLVEREEQQTTDTLNHIADIQSAAITGWIDERLSDAEVFSSGRFLGEAFRKWLTSGAPNDDVSRAMRDQLVAIKASYRYLSVSILDSDGNVRLSTDNSGAQAEPSVINIARRAATSKHIQVTILHPSSATAPARHTIGIAAPLLNLNAQAAHAPSVLLLYVNADVHLEPFVQSTPLLSAPTEVVLAEIHGDRVLATAAGEGGMHFFDREPLPISPAALIGAAISGHEHFLLHVANGKIALAVARVIDNVPWYLVTMIDQNVTRNNLNRLAWMVGSAAAGVLALLGVAVLFWWKGREIEFRMQTLREHTEQELLRRESEAALRASEERLDNILASIHDVVWSFSADLTRVNYINPSVQLTHGFPPRAFIDNPHLWFDRIHEEDRARVEERMRRLSPEAPLSDQEYRIFRPDGEIRWLYCRGKLVTDDQGKPLRIDGVASDITQRKEAEQQVQVLAYYDNVTGLPNRRLLNDRLMQAMHVAWRNKHKVALLFMDLDNFKNVNDSLGHQVGDMLLRNIAQRLLQCVREEDTVSRIGGDEFLVVLPELERGEHAVPVAEKILLATANPFMLQGQQIHTTISIGISVYPDDSTDPHELIRHADSALYQAKSQGRDNYQFFTRELNEQITRSSNIERQLRKAIDHGDLALWYQPQVDVRNGKLIGAEALLRWRSKERDFLAPVEFIPVAEERGLIGKIGEWAIREACMQCRRWQMEGLPLVPVAVNVSPLQFQQKGFADLVTGILRETQLEPHYLELEITESAIMRRAPLVAELATRLREAGVGISIDDFGTGYSSLSYLKQIPIDKIKIDRSFISDMLIDADDNAITSAIINLAHSLNLRVIAEGVESKAQIERLRAFGCDEVQGHFFSSAVSAQAFGELLGNDRRFAEAMTAMQ